MAAKIRKGDKVMVLTGRDKGRTGEVFEVRPDEGTALVRGINMVKRHQKQTQNQEGGIISKESPIQLSNIAYLGNEDDFMPPPKDVKKYPKLTPEEVGLIRAWIDQGAK